MKEANTRVLVIDDEEMVRDNIAEILVPQKTSPELEALSHAAGILFDQPEPILSPRSNGMPDFTVDKASNGTQGLEQVKNAIAHKDPYAVIFLDMRMPGWDGLETARQIRQHDNKAEIIFLTAYSDHSIEDIVATAGQNVGYHCKPYAAEEILQLATKAVTDYHKLRNLEKLLDVISDVSLNEHQLTSLLKNILDQLAGYIGTDMALLGKLHEDYSYEKLFSIGAIEEKINLDALIEKVKTLSLAPQEVVQLDEVVLARMDGYTIFAVLQKEKTLKTEKLYLLKLFVHNTAKAIHQAELHEQLLQKEKLSAVGKALGMLMHDLAGPVGNIKTITGLMREEHINSSWLEDIDTCSRQINEIVVDFMDFIRDIPVHKSPARLYDIIDEGITMATAKNNLTGLSIQWKMAEDTIIDCDAGKLKRVIMNLVNNSVDALKDNEVADPRISISVEPENQHVCITCQDNGPGIPQPLLKTLFEPFVTRNKTGGTGLGLAIVKQYITAHGGTVMVDNNHGAIFRIRLPVTR